MDWLWFKDDRAKRRLDAATTFIRTPDRAGFYSLDGNLLPASETFTLGDGQSRSRREYSELTVGMWACAAFSAKGAETAKPWADSLLAFLPAGNDLWGRPADLSIPDRSGSFPNEQYFEQYLAWFSAAVLAGRFSNVWEDLRNPQVGIAKPLESRSRIGERAKPTLVFRNGMPQVRWTAGGRTGWMALDGGKR